MQHLCPPSLQLGFGYHGWSTNSHLKTVAGEQKRSLYPASLEAPPRLGAYLWASSCPPVQTPVVLGVSLIFVYRQLNVILIETHTHLYI